MEQMVITVLEQMEGNHFLTVDKVVLELVVRGVEVAQMEEVEDLGEEEDLGTMF
jgi:hypothetical protein